MKKRKIFTGTQKAKVALEAVKGTKTINKIAQEFGVESFIRHNFAFFRAFFYLVIIS